MSLPCPHTARTRPITHHVRAEGTQEIVGEATFTICCKCSHVEGTVHNGSLFDPKGPFRFEGQEGRFEVPARMALNLS